MEINESISRLTANGVGAHKQNPEFSWPNYAKFKMNKSCWPVKQEKKNQKVRAVYFKMAYSEIGLLNDAHTFSFSFTSSQYTMEITGKMQKPLPDLLREYDMPVGLFPRDATNYEFNEETGKLTVYIPSICEVGYKDSSVLRFFTTITGYLEKGKFADIEGMKTKVLIWAKVTSVKTEGSKVHFMTGVKKTRSRDAYEVLRDGVGVDKF